jgi:mannose-6-phosphate isomerase-like protein (cupin superfamily)
VADEIGTSTALAGSALERIAKPWGEELILNRTADTVIKALRINPNQRLSLQFHRFKRETLMLLGGEAVLTVGSHVDFLRDIPLRTAGREEVAAGVIHRVSAGPSGADILEIAVEVPDDAEDIVRLADDYGRADPSEQARPSEQA